MRQINRWRYIYKSVISYSTYFADGFLLMRPYYHRWFNPSQCGGQALLEPVENMVLYMLGGLRMHQVKSTRKTRMGNICMKARARMIVQKFFLVTKMTDHSNTWDEWVRSMFDKTFNKHLFDSRGKGASTWLASISLFSIDNVIVRISQKIPKRCSVCFIIEYVSIGISPICNSRPNKGLGPDYIHSPRLCALQTRQFRPRTCSRE